ncbi:MAG: LLM class flavin-dependent oxidoreductase [Caldilinea sp. CFX5]|nr:LLM class flavin-dependent oxidoreductase [Caldilinea sp. CFX5]
MTTTFGFCLPIFAGAGGAHMRTPLLDAIDFDQLQQAVVTAEQLGYDSLWVADHLILGSEGAILEGWTVLAALARVTTRLRLGSIHLANRFRSPAVVAKMAATLDFITNGRLEFFFDPYAGNRPEAEAYGLPFVDEDRSLAQFEEAIHLIKTMWTADHPTVQGHYYQITDAICRPRPIQQPSIPFWIGTSGGGDAPEQRPLVQKMAPIIARHADWWNITPISVEGARRVLTLVERACEQQGRPYASLRKSLETQILVVENEAELQAIKAQIQARNPNYANWDELCQRFIIGDVATVCDRLRAYQALGIECFMLWFMDYPSLAGLQRFAQQVMPQFR